VKEEKKLQQAIGRPRERHPRVARYYPIDYGSAEKQLAWQELAEKKAVARKLDGSYVLKTDRQDLGAEGIWRSYILLTWVEDAFRDMKSPLLERPTFHHLQNPVQTHVFLCVQAYHLLAAIGYCLGSCYPAAHVYVTPTTRSAPRAEVIGFLSGTADGGGANHPTRKNCRAVSWCRAPEWRQRRF